MARNTAWWNYKNTTCWYYSHGVCRFGDKCYFRHVAPYRNSSASAQACTTSKADAEITAENVELIDASKHRALLAEVQRLKDEVSSFSLQHAQLKDEVSNCKEQGQHLAASNQKLTSENDELKAQLQETQHALDAILHEYDDLKEKVRHAEADKFTQQSAPSSGSNGRAYMLSSRGAEWQFQVAANEWAGLPADSSEELRKHFEEYVKTQSGNAVVSMRSGVDEYEFDFQNMTQLNIRTGKLRCIRCNFDTPGHWTRCVNMESIYLTGNSTVIEISGFYLNDHLNGIYQQSKFDTRYGQPVWWKEDGSVIGHGHRKGNAFFLKPVNAYYATSDDVCVEGKLNAADPCAAGVWKEWVGPDIWDIASVSVVLRPSASLGSCHSFVSLAVELSDEGTLQSLKRILEETVTHASKFKGVSACNSFKRDFRIQRVLRIENWNLWTKYCNHVDQMSGDLATQGIVVDPVDDLLPQALVGLKSEYGLTRSSANECFLFHGTTYDVAVNIAREGFDFRLSNAGYYGHGTYFASQACKSHQYTESWRGLRTILISRVAVGDICYATQVDKECRRPPVREGKHRCYDSIVAKPGPMVGHTKGNQTHQEFVVFDKFQAYPELIIQYAYD